MYEAQEGLGVGDPVQCWVWRNVVTPALGAAPPSSTYTTPAATEQLGQKRRWLQALVGPRIFAFADHVLGGI